MAGDTLVDTSAGSTAPATDAISLLRRDHGIVSLLFDEFSGAEALRRDPLARRICKMLNVHAQIEEEIFYPVVRAAIGADELISEAEAEHARIKQLVATIEASGGESPGLAATMQELADAVAAHVRQEERGIFGPLAAGGLDLVALGAVLAERKLMLMELMGLHDDDELPAQPEARAESREPHE